MMRAVKDDVSATPRKLHCTRLRVLTSGVALRHRHLEATVQLTSFSFSFSSALYQVNKKTDSLQQAEVEEGATKKKGNVKPSEHIPPRPSHGPATAQVFCLIREPRYVDYWIT
jgi:hypothetical protein